VYQTKFVQDHLPKPIARFGLGDASLADANCTQWSQEELEEQMRKAGAVEPANYKQTMNSEQGNGTQERRDQRPIEVSFEGGLSDNPLERNIQVVVMIMSAPKAFDLRSLIRLTFKEMFPNFCWRGHGVNLTVRFAVGSQYPSMAANVSGYLKDMLRQESETYGDMAFLDTFDGYMPPYNISDVYKGTHPLAYCDFGKSWHQFNWALLNFPDADLIFKQDDDAIVNWPGALSIFLNKSLGDEGEGEGSQNDIKTIKKRIQNLYVSGQQHYLFKPNQKTDFWDDYGPEAEITRDGMCAQGALYGIGRPIVQWIVQNVKPAYNYEDMESCVWLNKYDAAQPPDQRSNRKAILPKTTPNTWPRVNNALMHPIKGNILYWECYKNHGCYVTWEKKSGTRSIDWQWSPLPPESRNALTC
jgi:hypothetical protein